MFEKGASPEFKKKAFGVIILGFFIMYFSCCLATDAMNVLQPQFEARFGWSYTILTMPATVGGYIVIFLAFVYSTIIMKQGTRLMGTLSFLVLGIATLLIAFAYIAKGSFALILFSIGLFITKLGVIAIQMVCFQLCATWFHTTRGRILGIVTIGAPLNSATSVTLMTKGSEYFGFNVVYIIMGIILILLAFMAWTYGIADPEELGLAPDGITPETSAVKEDGNQPALTFKQLFKGKDAWYLSVAFGILNGIIGAVMANFIVRMMEVGININQALILISASAILGIPISYIYGWLDDKIGTIKAATILGISYVIMLISFYFASPSNMICVYIAVFGMSSIVGATPNLHPSSIIHVYGPKQYQAANRYIGIIISLISAGGMTFMSIVKDLTGNMGIAYIVLAVLAAIATVCIMMIKKQYAKGDNHDR